MLTEMVLPQIVVVIQVILIMERIVKNVAISAKNVSVMKINVQSVP